MMPIVFLHGSPSDRSVWTPVIEDLPSEVAHAIDLPDHGAAPRLEDDDPLALERLVAERIDHLVGGDSVLLVGHSYGAFVAARLAQDGSLPITKMVLVSGLAGLPPEGGVSFEAMARALESDELDAAALYDAVEAGWLGDAASEDAAARARGAILATDVSRLARQLRRLARVATDRVSVSGYDVPAILLHGDRDAAVSTALGRELAAVGADTTFELVPTSSHMLPLTHPDRIRAAVGA